MALRLPATRAEVSKVFNSRHLLGQRSEFRQKNHFGGEYLVYFGVRDLWKPTPYPKVKEGKQDGSPLVTV